MDKISEYFKGCFGHDRKNHPDSIARPRSTQSEEHEDDQGTDGETDDNLEEMRSSLELKDVLSAFKTEADKTWQVDVTSAVHRERSCTDSSDGSLDGETRKAVIAKHLLRHAASLSKIHRHFLKLDPKKCSCWTSNIQNGSQSSSTGTLKTVQEDDGERQGRYRVRRIEAPIIQGFLNEPERSLYKRVLLCAKYPVLSAPLKEPSITPSSPGAAQALSSSVDEDATLSPTDKLSVEPDMLMRYIRESFGVTPNMHAKYYHETMLMIPQNDPSKLLLQELQERLYQLETNQHNYYRSNLFFNKAVGYPKWRNQEIEYTKKLIRKFWKKDIPRNLGMPIGNKNAHEEYRLLQEKLFAYEMKNRRETAQGGEETEVISVFPVSSNAKKILKEFGLRYGVCSLYRQIRSLVCLAENFEYKGWYYKCVTQAVFEIKKSLQKHFEIIVEDELEMLKYALNVLHEHIAHTFNNTRFLFPSKLSFDAVAWILEMFKAVMKIKNDLGIWDENEGGEDIKHYLEKAMERGYKKVKELAMENFGVRESVVTPRVLRSLLLDMRKELEFYKQFEKECPSISRYLDVVDVASGKLYLLLMKDTKDLFVQRAMELDNVAHIDSEVLGLAYLFSELDQDWQNYIPPSKQKWRIYFMMDVKRTMSATFESTNKLVRVFMQNDLLRAVQFQCPDLDEDTVTSGSSRTPVSVGTGSILTVPSSDLQSERSAFHKIQPKASPKVPAFCTSSKSQSNERLHDDVHLSSDASSNSQNEGHSEETIVPIDDNNNDKDSSVERSLLPEQPTSNEEHEIARELENGLSKDSDSSSVSSLYYQTPPEGSYSSAKFYDCNSVSKFSIDSYHDFYSTPYTDGNNQLEVGPGITRAVVLDILEEVLECIFSTKEDGIRNITGEIFDVVTNSVVGHVNESQLKKQHSGFATSLKSRGKLPTHFDAPVVVKPKPQTWSLKTSGTKKDPTNSNGNCGHESFIEKVTDITPQTEEDRSSSLLSKDMLHCNGNHLADISNCNNTVKDSMPKPPKNDRSSTFSSKDETTLISSSKDTRSSTFSSKDDATDSSCYVSTIYSTHDRSSTLSSKNESTERSRSVIFSSRLSQSIVTNQESSSGTATPSQTSTDVNLPEKGQILVSSSLADILITVFRVCGFYSKLCEVLVPKQCGRKFENDLLELRNEHNVFKGHLFNGLLSTIKATLVTYGVGILALDVCGLEDEDLEDILSPQLLQRIREKQKNGLISGCRHDPKRRLSENARLEGRFLDYCPHVARIVRFCIAEWEAISSQNCLRLNNIKSLIDALKYIEKLTRQACGKVNSMDGRDDVTEEELKSCQLDLQRIWNAQVKILADRLVTMLEKVIDLLLSLSLRWTDDAPYKEQLKPVSVFLECQMEILRENLYPSSLREVCKEVWERLLSLFDEYAHTLRMNRKNPKREAKRFIQLMSICLKHLFVDDETGNKLIERCKPILLRLRLHFYSPEKLESLSAISESQAADLGSENPYLRLKVKAKDILLNMHSIGELDSEFSGENFVQTILNNSILLQEFGIQHPVNDEESAVNIGNSLLRNHIISLIAFPGAVEIGIRCLPRTASTGGGRDIRISGLALRMSPGNNSTDDEYDNADTGIDREEFQNSPEYIYQICEAALNDSDLILELCRAVRQRDDRFLEVIRQDISHIREYRDYFENDQTCCPVLKMIKNKTSRPKAASWPFR